MFMRGRIPGTAPAPAQATAGASSNSAGGGGTYLADRFGETGVPVSFRGRVRRLSKRVFELPEFEGGATLMLQPLGFSLTTKEGTAISAALVSADEPLRGRGVLFGNPSGEERRVTISVRELPPLAAKEDLQTEKAAPANGAPASTGRVEVQVDYLDEGRGGRAAAAAFPSVPGASWRPAYRFDLPWSRDATRQGAAPTATLRVPESVLRDAETWGMFRAMAADKPAAPPPAPRPPAKVHTTDLGFSGRLGAIIIAAVMFLVLVGAAALAPPEAIFGTIG